MVPFINVTNQQYQIVANTNGTIVNADGREYQLNIGEYRTIITNTSTMVTSNYPIQLIQMGQVCVCFIFILHTLNNIIV